METLARGTALDAGDIRAPGAAEGTPIVVERGLGECPHGFWYEASQHAQPLLLTVLDPILVAQADVRARLQRDVERAMDVTHRNLLPCYGMGSSGVRVFIAEAWPAGGTVREFSRQRRKQGQPLDASTAYSLVAHVCNALTALHPAIVHGYVTVDTVHVSREGRVLLAATGIGPSLPRARGFSRFRSGGLLPCIAPEQVGTPARPCPGSDVHGVATLFIELLTGNAMREPGQSPAALGIDDPRLLAVLERATDPEPDQRQPDVATFKAELAHALRAVPTAVAGADVTPPPLPAAPPVWAGETVEPAPAGRPPPPPPPPPGVPMPVADSPSPMSPLPPAYPVPAMMATPEGYPAVPMYGPPLAWPGYPPPAGYPYAPAYVGYPAPAMVPVGFAPPPAASPEGPWAHKAPGRPPGAAPAVAVPDPAAAQRTLEELDRATRRLTQQGQRNALAMTKTLGAEPAGGADAGPPSPSASLLGLDVGALEDAAGRLSTLDGVQDDDVAGVARPTKSGTYFGNMPDVDESARDPNDDPSARFVVVRGGIDEGPYDLTALQALVRAGAVRSVDVLRRVGGSRTVLAVNVPRLRDACEERAEDEAIEAKKRQAVLVRPDAPAPSRSRATLTLIAIVIALFSAAAWWISTRGG